MKRAWKLEKETAECVQGSVNKNTILVRLRCGSILFVKMFFCTRAVYHMEQAAAQLSDPTFFRKALDCNDKIQVFSSSRGF